MSGATATTATSAFADECVALRRKLHRFPELGWTEFYATWILRRYLSGAGVTDVTWGARELYSGIGRLGVPAPAVLAAAETRARELGVPDEDLRAMAAGGTGLVASLASGRPGPTIALRFDLDGLPIHESTGPEHPPSAHGFGSENPGVMHACGHDVHAAIGAGLAKVLAMLGLPERGRVRLLFQPAEEGTRGGRALVEAGWLDDVDVFLAPHVTSRYGLETGEIAAGVHEMLATWKLDIHLLGREAHAAASPESGRSALTVASAIALLSSAIPRKPDAGGMINVGRIETGTARNIIPADGTLLAEVRAAEDAEAATLLRSLEQLARGVGAAFDVQATTTVVGQSPSASSDASLVDTLVALGREGGHRIRPFVRGHGSDDAAAMMRRVQERGGLATYLHVGSAGSAGNHTARFDVSEEVIATTTSFLALTISALGATVDGGG